MSYCIGLNFTFKENEPFQYSNDFKRHVMVFSHVFLAKKYSYCLRSQSSRSHKCLTFKGTLHL